MHVLRGVNAHQILPLALDHLAVFGVVRDSRNGEVLQSPEPVATVYERPCERVVYHAWRDANPFFHVLEKLWMLAGRRDLPPLLRYVQRFAEFSDDGGKTQNAAYGYRWRSARGFSGLQETESLGNIYVDTERVDQLGEIVRLLRENKLDRQCVLQIWDLAYDLGTKTRDHACNLAATFQVGHDGRLDMSVFCRSNDIIWGCYGANVVHFSALLEYVARSCDLPVGRYTQISVNWHAYSKVFRPMMKRRLDTPNPYEEPPDPYASGLVSPYPLMSTHRELWDADCRSFVTSDGRAPSVSRFHDPFFGDVALPIVRAHDAYKDGGDDPDKFRKALDCLSHCHASDWRMACVEWIERRRDNFMRRKLVARARAEDDGVHAAFDLGGES